MDVEPPAAEDLVPDFDDDVEAEVAELLGEDHPLAHPEQEPRSTGD
jgi:hypothetical protein